MNIQSNYYIITITETVTMKRLPNMEGTDNTLKNHKIQIKNYFKFLSKDKGIAKRQ